MTETRGVGGRTGFFSADSASKEGGPEVTALLSKARQSLDANEQRDLFHEFRRMEAANLYQLSNSGSAEQLDIAWPAIMNLGIYEGDFNARRFYAQWLDSTKAPLA